MKYFFCVCILFLSGCLSSEEIAARKALLSECNQKDFSAISLLQKDGKYFVPFNEIEKLSFTAWAPIRKVFDSGCDFGVWRGQYRNMLYCYNSIVFVLADEEGTIAYSVILEIESVFRKDKNSLYFVEHACRMDYGW